MVDEKKNSVKAFIGGVECSVSLWEGGENESLFEIPAKADDPFLFDMPRSVSVEMSMKSLCARCDKPLDDNTAVVLHEVFHKVPGAGECDECKEKETLVKVFLSKIPKYFSRRDRLVMKYGDPSVSFYSPTRVITDADVFAPTRKTKLFTGGRSIRKTNYAESILALKVGELLRSLPDGVVVRTETLKAGSIALDVKWVVTEKPVGLDDELVDDILRQLNALSGFKVR